MTIRSLVACGALLFASALAQASVAPEVGSATTFSIQNQTQIPGRTLKPGTYNIRVVDHLSDRLILRVDGPGSKPTTFIGLPSSGLTKPAGGGPIALNAGASAQSALRGFAFPDGTVTEFVYPKAEAVSLAKANDTTIPAIDPASEGKPDALASLSHSDMEMVTLWMLSPTPVGPDTPAGIQAARYKAPAEQASNNEPAPPRSRPAAKARPVVAALPHTASELPLVWLAGLLSLIAAGALTTRRLATAKL